MKIDLSKLPEGARWISIDKTGLASIHSDCPVEVFKLSDDEYRYVGHVICVLGNVHD